MRSKERATDVASQRKTDRRYHQDYMHTFRPRFVDCFDVKHIRPRDIKRRGLMEHTSVGKAHAGSQYLGRSGSHQAGGKEQQLLNGWEHRPILIVPSLISRTI